MEIRKRTDFDASMNVIDFILRARGVRKADIPKFLFPDSSLEPDYNKLENIDEGIELLKSHLKAGSKLFIAIDPDMDGYSSSTIIYQFITKDLKYSNVSYYVPKKKIHGINTSVVLENKPELLIVPDAGSSDFDEHKTLRENGIDTLVIDHHLVEGNKYSDDALVINNQLSKGFQWKSLTGSSMAYLFVKAFIERLELDINYEKYLDLNAIGLISDRADLRDTGAFYYASVGLKKVNNELIQFLVEKSQNLEVGKPLTPKDIGFEISPFLNAMTREGKEDDINLVVDALFGLDYEVYNSRLKIHCSVIEQAARTMATTRNRQSKKVKEAMEKIDERIKEKGTDENKIIFVNSTGIIEDSGLNGLVATKISDKYKKPTLIMQYYEDQQVLKGSGRNSRDSAIEDLRQFLEDTELFNYVSGHAGAFGVGIGLQEAASLIDVTNELLADVEFDNVMHTVDLSYTGKADMEDILEIANHQHLWGEGLDSPLVHIHSIRLKKDDIKLIGNKGNTWKLNAGVDCIMFNLSEEQLLTLTKHDSDEIEIEIVGECSLNTFRGQKQPQVIIKDFDVKSVSPFDPSEDSPWSGIVVDELPF